MEQEKDLEVYEAEVVEEKKSKGLAYKLKNIKTKYIIIVAIIAAVAVAAGIFGKKDEGQQAKMTTELVAAQRRDIKNTVTGASVIEPKDSYSVTARITGEILEDTFNEGDIVKKGDVLYKVDAESAEKSVKTAQNSLEKAKRNYQEIVEDSNNLAIKSDIAGKVSEVLVKKGDNVNSGTKIANVYSDTYMKVRLPFNENDVSAISIGATAEVTIAGTGNEIFGRVTQISTASTSTQSHAIVKYVTIEVKNPGALTTNDSGTAIVNGVACSNSAMFEYTDETVIEAKASGKVEAIYIDTQDKVSKGQIVVRLASDDIADKLKDAKTEVDEAELRLEDAKDNLADYTITAPIDGTIVIKNKKAGDNMMSGSNSSDSNSMAEIYDLSSLKFQMDVDETDVKKVKVGQTVTITADAVIGEFYGKVTKVGIDGTSSNGVTTYPINVEIKEYGELLPGMNITAEIVVEEANGVLAIPVSAVHRGGVVYVKDDGKSDDKAEGKTPQGEKPEGMPVGMKGSANGEKPQMPQGERPQRTQGEMPQRPQGTQNAQKSEKADDSKMPQGGNRSNVPEGYKAVRVELGINDLEYIEVISGLQEGQEVLVQSVAQTTNTKSQQQMMPGMGGGMPGMGGNRMGGQMGGNRMGGTNNRMGNTGNRMGGMR